MRLRLPTYFFIVMMFLTVGVGVVRFLPARWAQLWTRRPWRWWALQAGHAFPDPARLLQRHLRPDRRRGHFQRHHGVSRNRAAATPGITLIWMSTILGSLFLGITFLAGPIGASPPRRRR